MSRTSALLLFVAVAVSAGMLVGGDSGVAAFPGRNGEIAFSAGRGYPDLYLIRADGTRLRRISSGRGSEGVPKWSPDGKRIAFVSDRSRPRHESALGIYVMRANGSDLRRVTPNRFVAYDSAWAPDGKSIAFVGSRPSSASALWEMNLTGGGLRRLATNASAPDWSPDGATIAFQRPGRTLNWNEIWLMTADGSNQRQLTVPPANPGNESYGTDVNPAWSPDGKWIAFTRQYRGRTDIYAIRPNGTGTRRLTKTVGQHGSPAWSPDGRRIIFVTARYQRRELNVMNVDGTQQKSLSTDLAGYSSPDWQPLTRR